MKRIAAFAGILCFSVFFVFGGLLPSGVGATPTLPADCSGTLTSSELEDIAWYMVNNPGNSADWARCAEEFDIGITYNYDTLLDHMYDLGWTDPPDNPDAPPPGWSDECGECGGLDMSAQLEESISTEEPVESFAARLINEPLSILEFSCGGLPCWKQMVERAGMVNSCPGGYNCEGMEKCYDTTTYCDDDPDTDLVCKTKATNCNISDPDSAKVYAGGSLTLQASIPSGGYSSNGKTNSKVAYICVSNRTRKLIGADGIKASMRFRHDVD